MFDIVSVWNMNKEKLNHYNVSLAKSALRILAGVAFITYSWVLGGVLLILAEVLGILEEVVPAKKTAKKAK